LGKGRDAKLLGTCHAAHASIAAMPIHDPRHTVHGTNSMICANSVLPAFIVLPREHQSRESTQKWAFKVQIGTKQNQPQSRANIRSCENGSRSNRTLRVFDLDQDLPDEHLPRSINRVLDLSDLRTHLEPYYSKIGRPGLILI